MFIYRYYDETDIYNNRYTGYEVGYFYNEYDSQLGCNIQMFKRVRSFTDVKEAARYCHYLNGEIMSRIWIISMTMICEN